MAIPSYEKFMLPTLQIISDNIEHSNREILEQVCDILGLSEEDRQQKLPSGTMTTCYNRGHWAITHLHKAKCLEHPRRGTIKITQRGIDLLKTNPKEITNNLLMQFDEFKEFLNTHNVKQTINNDKNIEDQQTPYERIESATLDLSTSLEDDLLGKIKDISPQFFEILVAKLLLAMGYGGSENDILQNKGKPGDEGIDGIIKQDILGLDKIYIQAKRWSGNVSAPEIQKFVGAIHGQNANRGVFITTSTFTNQALEYVNKIHENIVLVDGKKLVKLMIEHNVGVQVKDTILIKKIDEDFFMEEEYQ